MTPESPSATDAIPKMTHRWRVERALRPEVANFVEQAIGAHGSLSYLRWTLSLIVVSYQRWG